MRVDADRLDRALARAVAGVTSADEAYTAVCGCLRSELGDDVLASVYVADEDRLWLSAQRGYDRVIHTHAPGAGLFTRAYEEQRALEVSRSARDDPAYIEVVPGIESLAAAPFSAHVAGIIGIESRTAIDESVGLAIVEHAARAIEGSLHRLAGRGDQRASARLRLLRAVSALAASQEPLSIVELLARSVGDALGLDLVQVALVRDQLEPCIVWTRDLDRSRQLDADRFRAQAERFAYELVIGSEDSVTTVGLPLLAAGELVGYLIGSSQEPASGAHERIDEALVAATTAAQSLAGLSRAGELRDSREDLRASKESLERLMESVAEHVFCLERDPDGSLRVVAGRGYLVRVLGYDPPESVEPATVWMDSIHPDDRRAVENALEQALGGGPVDLEHRLQLPDGTSRSYRLRGRFRRDAGRALFDAMVADVSERQLAERERERAEQRLHAVVESLSEGLVVLGREGRIVSANASAHRILGRDDGDLIGVHPDESLSFVDVSGIPLSPDARPGRATLADGEPRTGVLMGVHRPDGQLRFIEENSRGLLTPDGELEGVVITFADVTERFEADRRLRSERDFTARVLNTIADGVLVTDELPDGGRVIVHVNDRICAITGFPREQLVGARTPFPWWPEDRHEELATAFLEATASGAGEYEAALPAQRWQHLPGRRVGRIGRRHRCGSAGLGDHRQGPVAAQRAARRPADEPGRHGARARVGRGVPVHLRARSGRDVVARARALATGGACPRERRAGLRRHRRALAGGDAPGRSRRRQRGRAQAAGEPPGGLRAPRARSRRRRALDVGARAARADGGRPIAGARRDDRRDGAQVGRGPAGRGARGRAQLLRRALRAARPDAADRRFDRRAVLHRRAAPGRLLALDLDRRQLPALHRRRARRHRSAAGLGRLRASRRSRGLRGRRCAHPRARGRRSRVPARCAER